MSTASTSLSARDPSDARKLSLGRSLLAFEEMRGDHAWGDALTEVLARWDAAEIDNGECASKIRELLWLWEGRQRDRISEQTGRARKLSKEALAIAALIEDPTRSNTEIAKIVGCPRTYLSDRFPFFRDVRTSFRTRSPRIRQGWRDDRSGNLEALSEGDEE